MEAPDERTNALAMESNVNRTFLGRAAAAAAFVSIVIASSASAAPVSDAYFGGTVSGYGDVVGHASIFDVHRFEAARAGTRLHVQIDTNFAGNAGVYASLTATVAGGRNGIGYGDLFLAGDWAPFGPAPYTSDDHATGTHWTYAFSLDNRWSSTGGSGVLYRLDGATNNANVLLSNDFLSGGIYRRGQVVAVDRMSRTVEAVGAGTWSVDGPNSKLLFDFDLAGSSLANDSTLALHWGMTCGNDVIEGVANVPTPAVAPMLALGLLAGLRRRARTP